MSQYHTIYRSASVLVLDRVPLAEHRRHKAWSQAGSKGQRPEVGAERAPYLLVWYILFARPTIQRPLTGWFSRAFNDESSFSVCLAPWWHIKIFGWIFFHTLNRFQCTAVHRSHHHKKTPWHILDENSSVCSQIKCWIKFTPPLISKSVEKRQNLRTSSPAWWEQ